MFRKKTEQLASSRRRNLHRARTKPRRLGWFEILELRIALSATSINGKPFVDLGPSDNVALDQPRIAMQLITPQEEVVGPSIFNSFLLDTGANTILTFKTAIDDMNEFPPRYTTEGTFEELGIGGVQLFDISSPYRFDFAGNSGVRNTLLNTRLISDGTRDLSIFGPWGIAGMPAMTERVTTYDFTTWTTIANLELFMRTDFGNTVPAYSGPRYSISVDDRITFDPLPHVKSGNFPPVWADLPFLTGQLLHNGLIAENNMLFDSGAQVSILSNQKAMALGLDSNLDGVLDSRDANFAREETISGISGSITVPVFLIDELHVPTQEGPDLVWTDLQWLILDVVDGIDAIFGFDNMTSGWIEAFAVDGQSGYIMKSHLDFRGWDTTGRGTIYVDINPEIHSVVDPNGPGAVITESGGITLVSETGYTDTYLLALTQPPTANVRVNLVPALGGQVTAVDAANPSNGFLNFTPANWNIPQTVRVAAVDDSIEESFNRSFVRHVSTSTDSRYQAVGMPRVIVNIIDNDFPGVLNFPSNGATIVTEGGATDTYQLVLTFPPTQNVTIFLENAQNQVRAVAAVGGASSVVFTPANWNVPQTILVTAVDDTLPEGLHKGFISHRIDTTDAGYQQAFTLQEIVQINDNDSSDTTPPRIVDVIVGSTGWSTAFIDAVDGGAVGSGNGLGMSLPGPGQLANLSQHNINKIYLRFSENVSASLNAAKVALVGTNRSNYMPIASLAYGVDGTNVATITLSQPIANDALILAVFDTLTDAAGNRLDGEWTSSVSLASGNGSAGGQFNFRMDVLPGDVDNSNGVNTSDLLLTHSKNGDVVTGTPNAAYDVNGNGGVNTTDLLLVYSMNATVLPAAPPAPSAGSLRAAGMGGDLLGGDSSPKSAALSPWSLGNSQEGLFKLLLDRLAYNRNGATVEFGSIDAELGEFDAAAESFGLADAIGEFDASNLVGVSHIASTTNQIDFRIESIILETMRNGLFASNRSDRGSSDSWTSAISSRTIHGSDEPATAQELIFSNSSLVRVFSTSFSSDPYLSLDPVRSVGDYPATVDELMASIYEEFEQISDLLIP